MSRKDDPPPPPAPAFDAAPLLKEIARGKHGAKNLTREQARELFAAVFAGEVADLALGALLVALRVKGENLDELAGMMDALQPHVVPLRFPVRRATPVMIPTYNGARKLPNLVPLLALLLAREGVPVLIHGEIHEARRVGAFEILQKLGHSQANSLGEAEQQLQEENLAAVSLDLLCPPLGRLISLREQMGVRNSGHTLAKLVLPVNVPAAQAMRLIAVTHPDFMELMREYFTTEPANIFLMRGVEGEPVVRLHAPQPMEYISAAGLRQSITLEMKETHDPEMLPSRDADATAAWTEEILAGLRPIPEAIFRQVEVIVERCRGVRSDSSGPALKLVSSR